MSSDGTFLWTENQARELAFNQLGTSACGLTAAYTVLKALDVAPCIGHESIPARQRNYSAETLIEYLHSRALAGYTHVDLISEVHALSKEKVRGVFCSLPSDPLEVGCLLEDWISLGVVPVVVLNNFLQVADIIIKSRAQASDAKGWPPGFDGLVIPWGGIAGVMLFTLKDNEAMSRLLKLKSRKVDLPLYYRQTQVIDPNVVEWNATDPSRSH
mmetsp:Transcript_24520/g.33812  ORF Transcript_24520/g.33812 Transcript_24520/m.33812 type:complete len:214 (+) Transcript_24520:6-647(+)